MPRSASGCSGTAGSVGSMGSTGFSCGERVPTVVSSGSSFFISLPGA